MAATRVTREDMVEQSVTDYLREGIFTGRGYPPERVSLIDAFTEAQLPSPLDKNYLAIGFNFDDGGVPAELGSDLLRRQYMIEVWVMGLSAAEGRNLANAVRDTMESEAILPLKDITAPGQPIIDYLMVDPVSAQRQPVPEPKPWQEFLWIVSVPVLDEYHARLV
jgi:hypothetical protein